MVLMGSQYRVDLLALQNCCEANYLRLQRLLPDWRRLDAGRRELALSDGRGVVSRLEMDWQRDGPYTASLCMRERHRSGWWLAPQMQVRIYHDARMAEVLEATRCRQLLPRYGYPNRKMYHPDEKSQLNLLLEEWLGHYLAHGHVLVDPVELLDIPR